MSRLTGFDPAPTEGMRPPGWARCRVSSGLTYDEMVQHLETAERFAPAVTQDACLWHDGGGAGREPDRTRSAGEIPKCRELRFQMTGS